MDEIRKSRLERNPYKMNICIDCKNACGGCSWTAVDPKTRKVKFEPVPGWTATPSKIKVYHGNVGMIEMDSYKITACPLFEKG